MMMMIDACLEKEEERVGSPCRGAFPKNQLSDISSSCALWQVDFHFGLLYFTSLSLSLFVQYARFACNYALLTHNRPRCDWHRFLRFFTRPIHLDMCSSTLVYS
jgi:hypothetical protein